MPLQKAFPFHFEQSPFSNKKRREHSLGLERSRRKLKERITGQKPDSLL